MRLDGSQVRRVAAVDGFDYHGSPRWSHDGKRLAFDVVDATRNLRKAYIVQLDGTGLTSIGDFAMPDWSPDDKQLVYCHDDDGVQGTIGVMGADGTGGSRVCDGSWPRWSPDGSAIAHTMGNSIRVLDLLTEEVRVVVDGFPQRPGSFDWSRDGRRLAFFVRTVAGGPRELYIVPAGEIAQNLKPRYARPGMVGGHVTWSPDDKQLAFTIDSQIHVMDVAGDKPPRLIPGQTERSRDPAWSPDGKWIAFARRNN
jgi:Tol biopolymer transport system component